MTTTRPSLYLVSNRPKVSPNKGIGGARLTVVGEGGTVDDLLAGWNADQRRRGLMPRTIERRADMVARFTRWAGGAEHLGDMTAEDVDEFLDSRRTRDGQPIGSRTRYCYLSCLGCFYGWAVRYGHLDTNPATDIDRPKLRRTLPRPIADADLAHALACSTGQHKLWLLLAAYAGLRCAEIAGLHRDDILHDLDMLRVLGKGAKERLVPMHPLIAEAFATWPMPRTNRTVFTRPSGGRWTDAGLSAAGSDHLHDLGIDATLHQLRHWFGTRTLRQCGNIRTVQELMGHASPTTTAIYTAFCNEDGRAAVLALDPPTAATTPAARQVA